MHTVGERFAHGSGQWLFCLRPFFVSLLFSEPRRYCLEWDPCVFSRLSAPLLHPFSSISESFNKCSSPTSATFLLCLLLSFNCALRAFLLFPLRSAEATIVAARKFFSPGRGFSFSPQQYEILFRKRRPRRRRRNVPPPPPPFPMLSTLRSSPLSVRGISLIETSQWGRKQWFLSQGSKMFFEVNDYFQMSSRPGNKTSSPNPRDFNRCFAHAPPPTKDGEGFTRPHFMSRSFFPFSPFLSVIFLSSCLSGL